MSSMLATKIILGAGSVDPVCSAIAFHPSGDWIVSSSIQREKLTVIRCDSGEFKHVEGIAKKASSISFSNSGNFFVAVSEPEILFWKWHERGAVDCVGRVATPFQLETYGDVPMLPVREDNVWIFGSDKWVLWSVRDCKSLVSLEIARDELVVWIGHDPSGNPIAITYDQHLVNNSQMTLSVVDLNSAEIRGSIPTYEWNEAIVSIDGKHVVLQGQEDRIGIWDLGKCRKIHSVEDVPIGQSGFLCQFCADNEHIISTKWNDGMVPIHFTNVFSGDRKVWNTKFPFPPSIRTSTNSNILAAYASDRRHPIDCTQFLDVDSLEVIAESTGHAGHGLFSPCRKWFASVSNESEWAVNPQPSGTVRITRLDF